MANGTENGQTNTTDANANNAQTDTNNSGVGETSYGDTFDKHLDIAIEAQDGPKTKAKEETSATESGTEGKSADSTSGTGDSSKEQQSAPKDASEAGRILARAKDIKVTEGGQEIVVKGGPERRFYEQREVARQERDAARRELEELRSHASAIEKQHKELKETVQSLHGADPNAVRIGVRMVSDLQRDPVGTMKKLLAEVTAQGYKIEEIGAGVDTAAIQRMIDERLPANTQTTEQTDEEILAEATAEANAFFGQYPDARVHDELIAQVMRDHPGTDLRAAYFNLKSAFIDKGFDWSRTLQDNLKEASGHSNTDNTQTNNEQNQQQQKPLPNGRAPDAGEFKLDNGNGVVHEDTDTSEIVKQAMREAGMNI